MVEELKILAEILGNVTDGALIGAITCMVLNFLKTPILAGIVGVSVYKIVGLFTNKTINVIEIEDETR